jgi:hypothetical protein
VILFAPLLAAALTAQGAPRCADPPEGWLTPDYALPRDVSVNRLRVSGRDGLRWNGAPVSRATLSAYLAIVRTIEPRPITLIEPAQDVDCRFLEAMRAEIARAMPCAGGLCGEGIGWAHADDRPFHAPVEPAADLAARRSSAGLEAERESREAERAARAAVDAACSALGQADRARSPC